LCALDRAGAGGDGDGLFEALHHGVGYAGEEEDGQEYGDLPRGVVSFFYEPPEVDDASAGCEVDEAVETLPVFAAHGSHDEGGRGAGEGEQEEPGEEAYLDKSTFEDVIDHAGPDELPLGDDGSGMAAAEAC